MRDTTTRLRSGTGLPASPKSPSARPRAAKSVSCPTVALRLPAPPAPPATDRRPGRSPDMEVLFLPAHDEEATVAEVVARVPELVLGRPVECLVVDDGSGDRTASGLAAGAGAAVLGGPTGAWGRPCGPVWPPPSSEGGDGRLLRRRPRVRPGRAGPPGRPHPWRAGRLRGRLPVRRPDPAHAAPAPPRQPGPDRPPPVRGQSPDRRRPERRGPVEARPRPTPRSSTTTTTPRSSPWTCWPRLPLPRGPDRLPVPHHRPVVRPAPAPLRRVLPAVWQELNSTGSAGRSP